jgi:hypothetical protein
MRLPVEFSTGVYRYRKLSFIKLALCTMWSESNSTTSLWRRSWIHHYLYTFCINGYFLYLTTPTKTANRKHTEALPLYIDRQVPWPVTIQFIIKEESLIFVTFNFLSSRTWWDTKFSLYLIHLLQWRRMEEWKYSSIIFVLGTRWIWVSSIKPRPLYLLVLAA